MPSTPHVPRITQWGDVFLILHCGGETWGGFDDDFCEWWSQQVSSLEQFSYADLDFCSYPEMIIPP